MNHFTVKGNSLKSSVITRMMEVLKSNNCSICFEFVKIDESKYLVFSNQLLEKHYKALKEDGELELTEIKNEDEEFSIPNFIGNFDRDSEYILFE